MEYQDWLNNLKEGDVCRFKNRQHKAVKSIEEYRILVIARTTKTTIVMTDGSVFFKKNGYMKNDILYNRKLEKYENQ